MACHCVANPVPVLRVAKGYRMSSFTPLCPSKKLRFNHPALSKLLMMTIMMMNMIIIIVIIIINRNSSLR